MDESVTYAIAVDSLTGYTVTVILKTFKIAVYEN